MILLTGVTGLTGRAAAEVLLGKGVAFRGLTRDPGKAADLGDRGVELVQGDLLDAADIRRAMEGIQSALLVTPNCEKQLKMERILAQTAAESGVGHLVKISTIRATPEATAPFPATHYRSEEFIKSLGLRWTMLRANFFMQNFLTQAKSIAGSDSFSLPLGSVSFGMIDARDVGEMAAHALMQDRPESGSHDLSGPEMLDCRAVARRMSAVFGREIRYAEQSIDDFRSAIEKVIPIPWQVNALCAQFREMARNELQASGSEAGRLLGRPPRSLDLFLQDYAMAFRG